MKEEVKVELLCQLCQGNHEGLVLGGEAIDDGQQVTIVRQFYGMIQGCPEIWGEGLQAVLERDWNFAW